MATEISGAIAGICYRLTAGFLALLAGIGSALLLLGLATLTVFFAGGVVFTRFVLVFDFAGFFEGLAFDFCFAKAFVFLAAFNACFAVFFLALIDFFSARFASFAALLAAFSAAFFAFFSTLSCDFFFVDISVSNQ